MAKMFGLRVVAAAVMAGVAGTIANAAAIAAVVSVDRFDLAFVPGRYGVAVILCFVLPFLARMVSPPWYWIVSVPFLTVAPSLLAKLVFGAAAPWPSVLGFNLVFALAAAVVYRLAAPAVKRSS
ncbi:MAG: hypothetical protein ACI9JL_000893 [Paracoccaceae bacterium]|jgi:hypothetical protein